MWTLILVIITNAGVATTNVQGFATASDCTAQAQYLKESINNGSSMNKSVTINCAYTPKGN